MDYAVSASSSLAGGQQRPLIRQEGPAETALSQRGHVEAVLHGAMCGTQYGTLTGIARTRGQTRVQNHAPNCVLLTAIPANSLRAVPFQHFTCYRLPALYVLSPPGLYEPSPSSTLRAIPASSLRAV